MKIKTLASITFSLLLFIGGFIFIKHHNVQGVPKVHSLRYIKVSVLGAVRFRDSFTVKEGTKIGEILQKAELIYGADMTKINKDEKIFEDREILVPFLKGFKRKYPISKGVNYQMLVKAGIRSKTAKKVASFIKEHKGGVTWEDLDSLRGVGEVTLSLLKETLDLN
ncbi:MAG0490 family ComEA-like DNA-binding protein [Mycoplasma marinum]|uniref:Uncharacterized protein n=1 Tax=Mycoplasma marinum TaxID=1937190 RepID=A0A4R0XK17_9MOLU|nr:hypothetical protein [Mycoplasma marinum]TCG10794.1 hypothetical protein C4B24_03925 [Mycoplasma marinum]